MVSLVKLQCPNCGANLEIDSSLKVCFCQYCGTKILAYNENEYIIRKVDEAQLAKEQNLRLKLEMESKKQNDKLRRKQELEKEKKAEEEHWNKISPSLMLSFFPSLFIGVYVLHIFNDEPEKIIPALIAVCQIILLWVGFVFCAEYVQNKKWIGILAYIGAVLLFFPVVLTGGFA